MEANLLAGGDRPLAEGTWTVHDALCHVAARSNDTHMERAALSGGAQLVSTDYEQPDPTIGNGYVVRIPDGTPARCDPVTGPPGCKPTDVEDPSLLAVKVR